MLRSVKEGWGNSWAIRFCFSQFLQNKFSLFPIISKVKITDLTEKAPIVRNGVDLNMNLILMELKHNLS